MHALLYPRKVRKLVVNRHLTGKFSAGHSIFSGILIEDKGNSCLLLDTNEKGSYY